MAQIRANDEFYETHGLVTSDGELVTAENPLPVTLKSHSVEGFYSFNNFGTHDNRGWTINSTMHPVFAIRVKPESEQEFHLINYDIGNNNANQSTIGYSWYNAPTITGPSYSWTEIGSTGIEYAVFQDVYGSNIPNEMSGGILNHSGVIIGKNTGGLTANMADAPFTDGGMVMVLGLERLDSNTKLDVWFAVTLEKDN